MKQTAKSCFPTIDNAHDNHGHSHAQGLLERTLTLHVGDYIEVAVEASDPESEPLEYRFVVATPRLAAEQDWSAKSTYSIVLTDACIGASVGLNYSIRSRRNYHAYSSYDDGNNFWYVILPS